MLYHIKNLGTGLKLSEYIIRARNLGNRTSDKKIKVAILSSFTLNGLTEVLTVKCDESKVNCSTYFSSYNQYNQDILNTESELYKFAPDVTFLILDTRSILGDLFYSPYSVSASYRKDFVEKAAHELLNLAIQFIKKSNSKLIISNFSIPIFSPYFICESKVDYGLKEMILDINKKLTEAVVNESSAYIFDFNEFVTKYGEINVFDYRQFLFGDIKVALDYIPYLADELMGYIKPILGINRKCIVVDLDNTLWGGIVGEDGFEGIELGPKAPGNAFVEFQHRLQSLNQRGIILAVNSKNNPDDALKVIREHPNMVLKEENFACLKINWNDKASNMREIAEELNIGLESIVYFDDEPANREFMRNALPDVLTVDLPKDPSLLAPILMNMNDFNVLKITEEDTKRGEMYLQQNKRKKLAESAITLEDFLEKLDMKIKIKKADKFTIPRISQLTLKTNQFNLTTNRYQEEEIRKFSQDSNMLVGCSQVEDKFGDNGITSAFIIKKNDSEWTVDTFLLSCRIMGRRIEDVIMGYILNEARKQKIAKVIAQYIPTKKNKPCEDFLPSLGFKKENDHWVYYTSNSFNVPKHIKLEVEK